MCSRSERPWLARIVTSFRSIVEVFAGDVVVIPIIVVRVSPFSVIFAFLFCDCFLGLVHLNSSDKPITISRFDSEGRIFNLFIIGGNA